VGAGALTIPAREIEDIKVVMTIVGGRVVYEASIPSGTR
jgi:predicted amidohydrolase YtcJ